ncbi:NRAMP family [Dillenia turbinata]|uniref:NRAMP family n=1 Tax=Dillenia turbinata TaxID=194707 RepID=A0AAN8UMQ8_9MAGN
MVVMPAVGCFLFLFLENNGVRKLEAVFAVLIGTMPLSFAWMFADAKPSAKELLLGMFNSRIGYKEVSEVKQSSWLLAGRRLGWNTTGIGSPTPKSNGVEVKWEME